MIATFTRRSPPPHQDPADGVNRSKLDFFQIIVMLHIKLRESRMQQHGSKYFACRHPPDPVYGVPK